MILPHGSCRSVGAAELSLVRPGEIGVRQIKGMSIAICANCKNSRDALSLAPRCKCKAEHYSLYLRWFYLCG